MRECAKNECHPESIIGKRVIREKEGKSRDRISSNVACRLLVDCSYQHRLVEAAVPWKSVDVAPGCHFQAVEEHDWW